MITKNPRGKNTVQLQLENRSTLLKLLRQHDHVCRKDLAEMSGLTGAAVTNLIRDLIEIGLVKEDRDFASSSGKNAIPLQLNFRRFLAVGVNLRRDHISYALFDLSGALLEKNKLYWETGASIAEILNQLYLAVQSCIQSNENKGRVIGIGVSAPGPINLEKGELALVSNVPSEWKQSVPIKRYLEERFNLPVLLDNNSNAAALAEKWFSEGQECHNLVSIFISKGMGAGVIIDDQIYHGAFGFAGEIGHMSINFDGPACGCGNKGCLELYCSTMALLAKAQQIRGSDTISRFEVFKEQVKKGDPDLMKLVVESGKYLGYAIVNLTNTFNPELIVINGDMNDFGSFWLDSIRQAALERLPPEVAAGLRIKLTSLSENPLLLGTVAMVSNYIFENPELNLFVAKWQA
ncbi:putative NBD/HSP70 family sugar kinase [Hydrogenispora ethanolica]|jgi:predicted NBD/HSP70 family sugar kinase|uniref:Putative NBD/HSP70 family sugar kinase n=1 Tax=Hydrogenispora ethanolica TaxID=1082276 RepID=A0A4R1SAK7_HYDET|nr:ROK family transcriptional regulator [Hydrogenispora ethanolica]TCL76553.1 putative NBD/HSP70 family sugar kinase [Hydrogenispora ethanolica]